MINVLAQGHNAVTPVRLEPAAPRSRVKHSTTEPLRFHCVYVKTKTYIYNFNVLFNKIKKNGNDDLSNKGR